MQSSEIEMISLARQDYKRLTLRTISLALSGYFTALMIEKSLLILFASINGLHIKILYDTIKVSTQPGGWDHEIVMMVYLFPLIIMASAFVIMYLQFLKREFKPDYKGLFSIWLMFFVFYRITVGLNGQILFKSGVHYAMLWLYAGNLLKTILMLVTTAIFYYAGYKILRRVLFINVINHSQINALGIKYQVLGSVLFPLLTVIIVSIIFYAPGLIFDELFALANLLIIMLYSSVRLLIFDPAYYEDILRVKPVGKQVLFLLIAIIGIILLRFLLGSGLSW